MTLGVEGGHSLALVAVVGYVHLPVVAAAAVALRAEHTGPGVESLGAVGKGSGIPAFQVLCFANNHNFGIIS